MTIKLYNDDATLFSFRAAVRACTPDGDSFRVLLDRTAFFPCEGGQGADHGFLGDARVLDAILAGDEIYHITDSPLPVGREVLGRLDEARRLRHMRVHSGEHILSGVLHSLFGVTNVGFHLGEEEVTLDTDIPLSPEMLARAEEEANRAVLEDRAVRILYPTPAELKTLSFRAKLSLSEGVRLVEIEGVDLCACCAPHVERTGQVGLIKIVGYMNYKGGGRLHIAVAGDALADYQQKQENVHAVSVALSVPEEKIAEGVARTLDSLSDLREQLATLRATLRRERLAGLAGQGDAVLILRDVDAAALRQYAEEGARLSGGTVLILLPSQAGCRYAIAAESGEAKERSAALHARFGGRGGGKPTLLQGSFDAPAEAVAAGFSE